MKKLWLLLLGIGILFAVVCINWGCRSVKRNKSSEISHTDSSVRKSQIAVKEITVTEIATKPFLFNPGNLYGTFSPIDSIPVVFENDFYKVVITPPKGVDPAGINITGKDKTIDVPVNKTTSIKETILSKDESTIKTTTQKQTFSKNKKGMPLGAIIVASVCILALLLALIYFFKR